MIPLLALALAATDLSGEVKARLVDASAITGDFTQAKQVRGFKKPLVSKGTFTVKRAQGVTWTTVAPFPSELLVSAKDIVSKQGGAEVFRLDGEKEPGVKVVTQVLFSVLSGDLEALAVHFVLDGSVTADGWTVRLTPKPGPLAKVFSRLTLDGHRFVEAVVLQEVSGDETRITLTNSRAAP